MNILVTGGAGFIGSHIIDHLIRENHRIICLDDLSLGMKENINHLRGNSNFEFIKLDVLDKKKLEDVFRKNKFECVFHFVANSDIQRGCEFPRLDLERTFLTTFNVLEAMKDYNVKKIIFPSSSAIYGELNKSLDENTGPLFPVSSYGAAKVSSEAYISVFCANYNIKTWILRFPNVVGERATHGVVFDFINKLKEDPKTLTILGDGSQKKPYLYVKDLVEGIIFAWKNSNERFNYFNLGVNSSTSVKEIAQIIIKEMNLKDVKLNYTGGRSGWPGDVPEYKYDLSKINRLGWRVKRSSDDAVKIAVRALLGKTKL